MKSHQTPTLDDENRLWQEGILYVAGLDEAGRGALAGPVVAGAVIVPTHAAQTGIWALVNDSKQIPHDVRDGLAGEVRQEALSWGVGIASAQEIDQVGIAPATKMAMQRALAALSPQPDYLLIDWVRLSQVNIRQESFSKGDQRCVSIAAASILAKTHRDSLLVALEEDYPDYGFAQHKGYGTAAHLDAIRRLGPCDHHRHSFAPIRQDPTLF